MSEMVERGARALCERAGVSPDDMGGGTWDGGSYPKGTPAWRSWCDDARAVLAALREPTDDMIVDGDERILQHLNNHEIIAATPTPAQNCWYAMIDRSLK